ncbi:MAG: chromosome segregation protein SMC [Lachnospiraceae bacterium]|nr:chromosome segregation protein SMC [Lachnospiraceae bacterium]
MFLKSIELQGFKSFARRTKLEFDSGLTGIVGPNGSGKSNIADAVRWVLGEMSAKQLRGSSMQDVIFAGTENKKPVSHAYVCLTFDNSDGALKDSPPEVSVARRVYRSGESEYLMNDTPCRMRDIVELFYDTGIGKEGYSIIGQGQVEKILNGKPDDRREMFDEAAGIMRFRKRREATRKKLESEQGSLTRVNDIISELERQVLPLERQAGKARQYLKLKEELKDYDIRNFRIESARYERELDETTANLDNLNRELDTAQETSAVLKQSYEEAGERLAELDLELNMVRSEREETGTRRETLEGNLRVLKEQIHSGETSASQIGARKEAIAERREAAKAEQEKFQEEKGVLNRRLDTIDDKMTAAKERSEAAEKVLEEMRQETARMQSRIIEIMGEKADVGARRQHFDTLREQTLERQNRLGADVSAADTQLDAEKKELADWQAKLDGVNRSLEKIAADAQKNADDVEDAATRVTGLNDAYVKIANNANTFRIRLENLQNLAERYEGFGVSVRKLMEAKSEFPGMIGTVADLIGTDAKYELALETALGGSLQNIVTDTEKTAKACIEYLKRGRYGRSTFLPLDSISARRLSKREALDERGAVGRASDLVHVDAKYRELAEHLLGNVLVVTDIDHALAIARKYHHDLRIVTLEGELLNRGGSITGGAYKNSSNLLGRNREIEELKEASLKAEKERADIEKALQEAREHQQSVKRERARLGQEREQLDKERISLSRGLEAATEKFETISARRNTLQSEMLVLEGKLEEIESQGGLIDASVKQSDEDREKLEKEIVALNKKIEKQEAKCAELRGTSEALTVEFNTLSQRDSFVLENLIRIGEDLEQLNREDRELAVQEEALSRSADERKDLVTRTETEIAEASAGLEVLDSRIADLSEERAAKSADQKRFLDERESVSGNISRMSQEKFRLEVQKDKVEEKAERALTYLWDEYELTPSQVAEIPEDDEISTSELRKKIHELKSQIKDLGPVNVNAIEDYVEVSERYHFMKGQQEDLLRAEEALRGVIADLDEGMRKQFAEKFEQIRVEFNRVFQELFGGGMATMELTDSDDVLDAGIQIIVQPPGKKLTNLMQMSGGEKALTAISILFAIQNLKPSPFCLLDEIEASLDDSNVDRFAEYLDKLSLRSQFITITHRRGTMTAAHRLYGITMQEKGISTLVSVDLT